ncbi:hypothetical protein D3C86_2062560 [compost metagenome]
MRQQALAGAAFAEQRQGASRLQRERHRRKQLAIGAGYAQRIHGQQGMGVDAGHAAASAGAPVDTSTSPRMARPSSRIGQAMIHGASAA